MTKQRAIIKEIISLSEGHLTAEEIYNIAKVRMPSIALGTVYRNLGKLCEDKEIKLISKRGFPDCYDKSTMPHGHLICDSCGRISDFPITDIGRELESELNTKLLSYDINAHYICEECEKEIVGDY